MPHAVLPSHQARFAITVWYYERTEKASAHQRRLEDPDGQAARNQERVDREIERMEQRFGEPAREKVVRAQPGAQPGQGTTQGSTDPEAPAPDPATPREESTRPFASAEKLDDDGSQVGAAQKKKKRKKKKKGTQEEASQEPQAVPKECSVMEPSSLRYPYAEPHEDPDVSVYLLHRGDGISEFIFPSQIPDGCQTGPIARGAE